MGLKKGMTNNPKGRPKGAVNKVTADLREKIADFLEDNWDTIQQDFDKMDERTRFAAWEKLLQYALPRLQSTEITSGDILDSMDEAQIDHIINHLKKKEQ